MRTSPAILVAAVVLTACGGSNSSDRGGGGSGTGAFSGSGSGGSAGASGGSSGWSGSSGSWGSSGSSGSGSGGASGSSSEVDCTFPNDPSICGCGNACGSDGLCEACGPSGSGCSSSDIWCCGDSDCPGGMQCATLSTYADAYHFCDFLDACGSTNDCSPGDVCESGYCRFDPDGPSGSTCTTGSYECDGDTLKKCPDGTGYEYVDCFEACFDAGYYYDRCAYSADKGHDTCLCTDV